MKNISGTDEFILATSSGRVLVDFWAEWCPPCKAMAGPLEELDSSTDIEVVKVNLEDPANADLVKEHEVRGIPLFKFYENGSSKFVWVGMMGIDDLLNEVNRLDDFLNEVDKLNEDSV